MSLKSDMDRLAGLQRELADLAKALPSLAGGDQEQALADAMAKRSLLLSRWQAARHKLERPFAGWPECLEGLPGDQAEHCREVLAYLKQSGKDILEWDRRTAEAISESRMELTGQLARLKQGHGLLKAYKGGGNLPTPARRISRSG